jgi:hypothetical protein
LSVCVLPDSSLSVTGRINAPSIEVRNVDFHGWAFPIEDSTHFVGELKWSKSYEPPKEPPQGIANRVRDVRRGAGRGHRGSGPDDDSRAKAEQEGPASIDRLIKDRPF